MCKTNGIDLTCGCHNTAAMALIHIMDRDNKYISSQSVNICRSEEESKSDTFTLIHNNGGLGTIRTVAGGDGNTTAEAILIFRNEIAAVGAMDEVTLAVNSIQKQNPSLPAPQVYTLQAGECVIPGMIEPHLHLTTTPVMLDWLDYSPFGDYPLSSSIQSSPMEAQSLRPEYNLDELLTAMRKDIKAIPQKDWWLLGNGVDTSLLTDFPKDAGNRTLLNCINNVLLDSISDEKAILLMSASGHTGYVNTPALKAAWDHPANENLRTEYKSLDNYIATTHGVLQEMTTILPVVESMPQGQLNQILSNISGNLIKMLQMAQKRGVTMVYDAGMLAAFEVIIKNALTGANIPYPNWPSPRIGMAKLLSSIDDIPNSGTTFCPPTKPDIEEPYKLGSLNLYYGGLKIISDGSNQGLTGYQSEPYCCPPDANYGQFNFELEKFSDLVFAGCKSGWPMMIHANGNQAIEYTLQSYENAYEYFPEPNLRHRIEHCSLLTDNQIDRIEKINVNPSFLIGHIGYWGWTFVNYIFGESVRKRLDRCNSIASRHIPLTLHSDCGVSPLGPLRMMEQAITRRMEGYPEVHEVTANELSILNAGECITPAQALAAVTYNAAWQCHADHLIGSIEVNKLADLVFLKRDPLSMTETETHMGMRNIPVLDVLIGGVSALTKAEASI